MHTTVLSVILVAALTVGTPPALWGAHLAVVAARQRRRRRPGGSPAT